jgi:hypothetical protein
MLFLGRASDESVISARKDRMREFAAALVIGFMPYTAFAQLQSGTVIIFNFTKDKLIVAADSRALSGNLNRPPDDSRCKISTFNDKIIFASSGTAVYLKSVGDPVDGWDNAEVARIAVQSTDSKISNGKTHIQKVADKWALLLSEKWNTFNSFHPEQARRAAELGNGILTGGIFVEAQNGEIESSVASIALINSPAGGVIGIGVDAKLSECWPCGQRERVCAMGKVAFTSQLCAQNPKFLSAPKRHVHGPQDNGWDVDESFTVWLATITALCDLTGSIGGAIDAISLDKGGTIHWIAKKSNCP